MMHPEDQYHSPANYHDETEGPGQAALRKGRYSLPNHAYFLTKCVNETGSTYLGDDACAIKLIECWQWLVAHRYVRCCGFVVMPDHYHVVLGLLEEKTLAEVMASFNRYTSRGINRVLRREGHFWEPGYYDHCLRDRKDFDQILLYMHENPVRAGLVKRVEDWKYSSANPQYSGMIDWNWLGASLVIL